MRRIALLIIGAVALLGAAPMSAQAAHFELDRSTFATALTAGPEGAIWFLAEKPEYQGLILGKMTAGGEATETQLPGGVPPADRYDRSVAIVAGPDGNLWFGERDAVGRSTAAGEVTSFPLAAGASSPTAMTVGPDGNVWFAERDASRIGRITPAGQVEEFPLSAGREPSGIALGSDGNLWFTEGAVDKIGRITPAGAITEFAVPGKRLELDSIAAGPDGNLWFAEEGRPRVGRITPRGKVTQFKVPTETGTDNIVAGPGGLLYFTSAAQIAAIAPSGKVSWPSCLVRFCSRAPGPLALGPDGRLWAAAGRQECIDLCGGGTAIGLSEYPGLVEPYALPPLRVGIGPRLRPLEGNRTSAVVACGLAHGCRGTLQLGWTVDRHEVGVFQVLAHTTYRLRNGQTKSIPFTFSRKFAAKLRTYDDYHLAVHAEDKSGVEAQRGFWLSGRWAHS
jgi:streptogramin lyase